MSSTRMRLGALVSAGVLSLGLTACGGDDDTTADETTSVSTPAEDTATDGSETTEGAGGGVEATTEAEDTGGDAADAAEGEEIPVADFMDMIREPGEEALSRYTMAMSMDLEGQTMDMDGAVDLSGDAPAMRMTIGMPDLGEMEMLLVDGAMYMAMPGLTPEGQYMEAPPEISGDLQELEEIDVSAQWDAWEEGAEKVVFMGTEDVDGTEMRRYELTVNQEAVDQAMETASAELGDDAMATSLGLDGPMVYDVYLDEDNFMRKMVMDFQGSVMEMTMDNWGEDQGIEAPSPDQITDMGDMGTGPTG